MDDLDLKKLNAMLGIPSSKLTNEDSEDEDQLEDELNAILSGQAGGRAKKPPTKSLINQMNQLNLDKIMQDNENDQLSDDEPIDENDPQLLAELSRYVPSASKQPKPEQPPVRVEPKTIIPNPAPSPKSTSATTCLLLQDHHFRSNDAPPLIPSTVAEPQPTAAKPQLPIAPTSSSPIEMLNDWRGAYRTKALNAKKSNDVQLALQCLRENKVISKFIKFILFSMIHLTNFNLLF